MIEHNSEVYNHPYISFFIVHVYMEEDLCRGGVVHFTVVFDHPSCFLTFCRSGIPTSCYICSVFYYLCVIKGSSYTNPDEIFYLSDKHYKLPGLIRPMSHKTSTKIGKPIKINI